MTAVGYDVHAPAGCIASGKSWDCPDELPDVSVESLTSMPIAPLAPASPVFPLTTVLSPTETIAPLFAITMPLPFATTDKPSTWAGACSCAGPLRVGEVGIGA